MACALAAAAGLTGCSIGIRPDPAPSAGTTPAAVPTGPPAVAGESPQPTAAEIQAARADLPTLRLIDRRPTGLATYDRDAFGPSWADADGNGCNQRDDVLLRDVLPGTVTVQQQGSCDHDVLAGSWVDPYTGTLLTFDDLKDPSQAQAIQIDHVVPLAEAWISGAGAWSPEQRADYANDLDGLLAVDGPTNAGKGADDPAAWRPRKDFQCAYAVRWVRTKSRWDLGVDRSESTALAELLTFCP